MVFEVFLKYVRNMRSSKKFAFMVRIIKDGMYPQRENIFIEFYFPELYFILFVTFLIKKYSLTILLGPSLHFVFQQNKHRSSPIYF